MRIAVEGIPAAGRDVAFGLRDSWATEAATTSLDRSPDRLEGTISLRRASARNVIQVDVKADAGGAATCDRCGEPCELAVAVDTRLLFAPEEAGTAAYDGNLELELQAEDLDLGWYTDGEIDLADVLREALALALPTRVVCADVAGCDKRTDTLLSAARAPGPFTVLEGLLGRGSRGEKDGA